MAHTLAVANQKGGVGKTSTTFHLAGAAARRGLRTLVIDADPQGNLTSSLGPADLAADSVGLADALSPNTDETLSDVIVQTEWEGVDLVPTTGTTLAAVQQEIASLSLGREHVLRQRLEQLGDTYELVLIDCPPSLDALSINAFTAASEVVVITHADKYAGEGLIKLAGTVSQVRQFCARPDLRIAGIIFNAYDPNVKEQAHWYREINAAAEQMEIPVVHPPVPKRITLVECTFSGTRLDLSRDRRAADLVPIFDRHLQTLHPAS
ncbi:ParA family protein [Micrococcus luteus]|uniref:ParA family protein n=1 Tax=Micrococcus TaxID=1269 RepID=UPI0030157EE5